MKTNKKFGWIPDLPDFRNEKFVVPRMATLPPSVDLSTLSHMPPIYDQDQLGSCVDQTVAGVFQFNQLKQNSTFNFIPSRLFIYYNARKMIGTVNEDSGCMIRDGIKSINKSGVCKENIWPYIINDFAKTPTPPAYEEAKFHKSVNYQALTQNITSIKMTLAAGYPIVFGFSVYDGFESAEVARTGVLNLPKRTESLLGGHAVVACGYNDATSRIKVRNSWGTNWGQQGYFTMPYNYITNRKLASDFWVVKTITSHSLT